ncbi:MAG: ATP-binding protein, partial [Actinobacteria bacterium]|nr:ATP-binding protein [Actinomycetota bacterium]
MVALSDQVYGRTPVISLVRDHMGRGGVDGPLRNQHFPILVIEGSRGAGKTALISALKELLDQRVPFATLDFEEANSSATVPQVLSTLALLLMKKCPRYGVLQFPRLTVGQLAIEQKLKRTLTAHKLDRRKVEEELERLRGVGAFREVLAKTAGAVLDTVNKGSGGLAQPSSDVLEIILKWLTARAPKGIVHGPALAWYGDQD